MSPQDLETLKQQIKDELLAEMSKSKIRNSLWDTELRPMIEARTGHLSGPDQYQVTQAISTLIRHSVGVNRIQYLPFSRQEDVKRFVRLLLDEMDGLRKNETKGVE